MGLRQALHKDGCRLLGKLIEESGAQLDHQAQRPGERCYAQRSRRMETILGPVELQRSYYHSPGKGRVPPQQAVYAQVVVQRGPVNAGACATGSPLPQLFRGRLEQCGIPDPIRALRPRETR